ncbi:TauD/TfdA family dioxygenase [Nocardia gipuzkoensis]
MPVSDQSADELRAIAARRRAERTSGSAVVRLVDIGRPARTSAWEPATIEARVGGLELSAWVSGHADLVRELVATHGAVLLTGMVVDADSFGAVVSLVADAPLGDYVNRSTPRTRVSGRIFTSTEYSADLAIPMHSEQSYTTSWPLVLGFWCDHPATQGGMTPLAPTDRVLELLPRSLVDRFEADGVCYERWYHPHLDLPWQEVFQTGDPQGVEALCVAAGIETHWEGELLRTRQTAQASVSHRGRPRWFNQASLFHPSVLPAHGEAALRQSVGDRLPRNAWYGDLAPISAGDIAVIGEAFDAASWRRPWRTDDVLLVDNVAVAHGRTPFRGARRVLVAMAGSGTADERGQM